MKSYSLASKAAVSLLLVGALTACGGGGSTPDVVAPAPTSFTVTGTAATGAVFANAAVTIITSDGTTYPTTGEGAVVTGADGSYTITLPLTAKPPFVVQAARDDKTLVSVVAEAKDTTTNITPITNLIASRLSSSGDPAKLAAEIKANPALVDKAKLTAKVAEIVALIKPLMDAVGDSTDPLNGKLVADGTGADKVLDSLSINITPSSATTVNIEVAVKQKLAEGVDPTVIAFTNATAPAAALPAVTAADLVASGTATLITDFLQRMTACYALPQSDRVVSGGTAAGDIKATACKDLFVGNDPASFKHNGAIVGAKTAWSSLFGTGSGQKFDRGSYEFTRSNDDLVIAYRATDTSGNSSNNILVVRADTDKKLRAIGNQYKYSGGVNAYQQLRTFINQPAADYYSTGYTLSVNNTIDPVTGKSIFAKVLVTTPKGGVLTLKPSAGSSYLPLVKINSTTGVETVTGTNFLRLRSTYVDPASSAKNPADADTTLFFAPTALSEAEIAAIPAQATWKFDYFLAGNTSTTPNETQYYKTRSRAMTVGELQTQPLANIPAADVASAKTDTKTNANGAMYLSLPATGPETLNWEVPTGALAPTSIQIFGGVPIAATSTTPATTASFNDNAPVASSARTGNIACSKASAGDQHCDSAGNFATGSFINGAHLWANDAAGREFAHFYAIYTVTVK